MSLCIHCQRRKAGCRGVCTTCRGGFRVQIANGTTTDAKLVANGQMLPVNKEAQQRWVQGQTIFQFKKEGTRGEGEGRSG